MPVRGGRRIPNHVFGDVASRYDTPAERSLHWRRTFGLGSAVADELARIAPHSREDLMASASLIRRFGPSVVMDLLRPPRSELWITTHPRVELEETAMHEGRFLLIAARERLAGGESRVRFVLADGSGELASACRAGDRGELSYSTFRLFGFAVWELQRQSAESIRNLYTRLHRIDRAHLLELGKNSPDTEPFARLATMIIRFQGFTSRFAGTGQNGDLQAVADSTIETVSSGTSAAAIPDEDDCSKADGCGDQNVNVPDFDIGSCCDDHDRCYCRSDCGECERRLCDLKLYSCILERSGDPVLAATYYAGVVSFSSVDPESCEPFGSSGIHIGGAAAIVGTVGGIVTTVITGDGSQGAAVGGALAAGMIAVGTLLLCKPCEIINGWREELQEWIAEEWKLARENYRKARKRCKKKKWWKRPLCYAKATFEWVTRLIWLAVVTVVTFGILVPIQLVIC